MHFNWGFALAGTFAPCHVYGRCWPRPRSVQMRQPNTAEELKEGQNLWDPNPEDRNASQTGWEGLEVSSRLLPASPYSLFTTNAAKGGKKMGIAGSSARKKRASSCQKAAFTLLFQINKANNCPELLLSLEKWLALG